MEKVGRWDGRVGVPIEDLRLGMETQVDGIAETPSLNSRVSRSAFYTSFFHFSPSSFPLPSHLSYISDFSRSSNSRVRRKEARVLARGGGRGRGDGRGSPVSIVSIPTPDSLSGQVSRSTIVVVVVLWFMKLKNKKWGGLGMRLATRFLMHC